MNIKEHIEAGHYPVDDKGRALVPMVSDRVAIIYCTDHGDGYCVLGRDPVKALRAWDCAGRNQHGPQDDLLPPAPRKVTKYAAVHQGAMCNLHWYESDGPARRDITNRPNADEMALLSMEYEEPWS